MIISMNLNQKFHFKYDMKGEDIGIRRGTLKLHNEEDLPAAPAPTMGSHVYYLTLCHGHISLLKHFQIYQYAK